MQSVDMFDAEEPSNVELPVDLMELFILAADDRANTWGVGLAMVATFTQVTIDEVSVRSAAPFHPIPGA